MSKRNMMWPLGVVVGFLAFLGVGASATHYLQEPYNPGFLDFPAQEDLLDELGLLVFPVVVGGGKRLFEDGGDKKTLELVDSKTFGSGVVSLTYRTAAG